MKGHKGCQEVFEQRVPPFKETCTFKSGPCPPCNSQQNAKESSHQSLQSLNQGTRVKSNELRKKPSYFLSNWLVYRDPYFALLKSPYNWVV